PYRIRDPGGYRPIAHFHGENPVGVHQAGDLPQYLLGHDHHAAHFHAAGGGANTAAEEGHHQEEKRQKTGPGAEVVGGEAGGGHDRHQLEGAVDQAVAETVLAVEVEIAADQSRAAEGHQQKSLGLRVAPVVKDTAANPGVVVQPEAQGRDNHEKDAEAVNQLALVVADTGVVVGKAAGGDGGKAVGQGVEEGHAGQPVGQGADDVEGHIDDKQGLGGLGDPRGHLAFLGGPDVFGAVQLHAADAQ